MKYRNLLGLISLSLLLSCGANSEEYSGNSNSNRAYEDNLQEEFSCLPGEDCLVAACDFVGGEITKNGCECPEQQVFIYESQPACHDVYISTSIDRRVKEDHEMISHTIYADENLYETNVYNYAPKNDTPYYSANFPSFVAPNFYQVHLLDKEQEISEKFVNLAIREPNIFLNSTMGDLSPIHHVRLTEGELSKDFEYYNETKKLENIELTKTESLTQEGCLGYCKKSLTRTAHQKEFKRIREYFKGVLAFDYLTIKEKGSTIIDYKVDFLARTILKIEKGQRESKTLKYTLMGLDLENSKSLVKKITPKNLAFSQENLRRNYGYGNVVLCDNGIAPELTSVNPNAKIVKGSSQESFYGWLNKTTDQSQYYSGLVNLNQYGTGFSRAAKHTESVYKYMRDVNIAPISIGSCLGNFESWAANVLTNNFKVINYAYYDTYDAKSCMAHHQWSKIQKTSESKKMLWVFSAGNDKSYIDPKKAAICPQNIATKNVNTIIVGSDPKFGGVTNKGNNYVDLFIDAPTTSQASAVVSSNAANILKRYPALSIEDVKRAILASVKDRGLSSRTGGFLDREKAFKAAKIINKDRSINNFELLEKVHCKTFLPCSVDKSWLKRFQ